MKEVWPDADDARQSALDTMMTAIMLRAFALSALLAAALKSVPVTAARYDGSGRVAWVTDGDTSRLESGERIRIAGIDAPETHRDRARCVDEITLGVRAKTRATALLAGRAVTFRRVGSSYDRTIAIVALGGHDLATELVRIGIAVWWPRGRLKPRWCGPAS